MTTTIIITKDSNNIRYELQGEDIEAEELLLALKTVHDVVAAMVEEALVSLPLH